MGLNPGSRSSSGEGIATHPCILAGKISWTQEQEGYLWSMGHRIRCDKAMGSKAGLLMAEALLHHWATCQGTVPGVCLSLQGLGPKHSQPSSPCCESEACRVCLLRGHWLGGQSGGKRSWGTPHLDLD